MDTEQDDNYDQTIRCRQIHEGLKALLEVALEAPPVHLVVIRVTTEPPIILH